MAPMNFMDGPDPPKIYGWPPTEIHFYTPWTPMDPPQTHFRVVPMKFMDGPQLLTTYGCPQKWKTEFSAITWNSHLHPMTHFNPFVSGPHEIYGWPPTYGWPRQAKNCILGYNKGYVSTYNVVAYNHPKFMNGPHVAYGRPQNLWMAPKNFR